MELYWKQLRNMKESKIAWQEEDKTPKTEWDNYIEIIRHPGGINPDAGKVACLQ